MANGADAFEAFKADPNDFDLLMTDRTMPRMSGAELVKEVLHLRDDIPIILTTSFSGGLVDASDKELSPTAVLLKPVGVRELGEAVRKALTKHDANQEL